MLKKTDDTIACKRCGNVVRRSPLAGGRALGRSRMKFATR